MDDDAVTSLNLGSLTAPSLNPQEIEQMRQREAARSRRVVLQFIMGSVLATLLFAVAFIVMDAGTYAPLIGVSGLVVVGYILSVVLLRRGFTVSAGMICILLPAAALFTFTGALSTRANAHMLMLPIGLSAFILLSAREARLRLGLGVILLVFYVVAELAFTERHAWAPPSAAAAQNLGMVNSVGAALGVGVVAMALHRRFVNSRQILEQAAFQGQVSALTDELTGVFNRRPVIQRLEDYEAAGRGDYGIAVLDVDRFKGINDEFGHECGDRMIQHLAASLTHHFRDSDMVSRWGGDEFLVLMPGMQSKDIVPVLERFRLMVAGSPVHCGAHMHEMTVSIGAALGAVGQSPDECIASADHALYRAKQLGRNRVVAVGMEPAHRPAFT